MFDAAVRQHAGAAAVHVPQLAIFAVVPRAQRHRRAHRRGRADALVADNCGQRQSLTSNLTMAPVSVLFYKIVELDC